MPTQTSEKGVDRQNLDMSTYVDSLKAATREYYRGQPYGERLTEQVQFPVLSQTEVGLNGVFAPLEWRDLEAKLLAVCLMGQVRLKYDVWHSLQSVQVV